MSESLVFCWSQCHSSVNPPLTAHRTGGHNNTLRMCNVQMQLISTCFNQETDVCFLLGEAVFIVIDYEIIFPISGGYLVSRLIIRVNLLLL